MNERAALPVATWAGVAGHMVNHLHAVVNSSEIKGKKTRSPNTNLSQNYHTVWQPAWFLGIFCVCVST